MSTKSGKRQVKKWEVSAGLLPYNVLVPARGTTQLI